MTNYKDILSNIKDNILYCTKSELDEYLSYGILLPCGDKSYMTRTGQEIKIKEIKVKSSNFNFSLSDILSQCIELSQQTKHKRIYCMSQKQLEKYKQQSLIVEKDNNLFYRLFDKELWLVNII